MPASKRASLVAFLSSNLDKRSVHWIPHLHTHPFLQTRPRSGYLLRRDSFSSTACLMTATAIFNVDLAHIDHYPKRSPCQDLSRRRLCGQCLYGCYEHLVGDQAGTTQHRAEADAVVLGRVVAFGHRTSCPRTPPVGRTSGCNQRLAFRPLVDVLGIRLVQSCWAAEREDYRSIDVRDAISLMISSVNALGRVDVPMRHAASLPDDRQEIPMVLPFHSCPHARNALEPE